MINIFFIANKNSVVQTYTKELLSFYKEQKEIHVHEVFLDTDDISEFTIVEEYNISIIKIPGINSAEDNPKYFDRAALLIYNYYSGFDNVLLHCNMPEDYHFAVSMKKLFNCPVVFTLHFIEEFLYSRDHNTLNNKKLGLKENDLTGMMLNIADQIICVSKYIQHIVLNYYGIYTDRIETINYGISQQPVIVDNDAKIKLKTRYCFNSKDRILLCNSSLSDNKGLDKLITAFMLLKDNYRDIKLVIAGIGEFDKYMTLAHDCIGRICFTGQLEKQALEKFCRFAEIGIVICMNSQSYYPAIEMMFYGLPIIIPDIPGLIELVKHKETGLVYILKQRDKGFYSFEPDENDLALQIRILLDDPQKANRLANTFQKECQEKFSAVKMGKETLKVYQKVIRNSDAKNEELVRKMNYI